MPLLRSARGRDRDLRAILLKEGKLPRRPQTALSAQTLLVLALVLAAGCAREAPQPVEAGSWYVLRDGRIETGRPSSAPGARPAPRAWTQQQRIADIVLRDGRLYLAVNGLGLSTSAFPPAGAFTDHFDPDLFGGRTITEIFPDGDGMLVHLYLNRILADADTPLPATPAPAFLRVPWADDASTSKLIPPWQAEHRDWEPVAVVRTAQSEFALEWKRTDDERTEFHYTTYHAESGRETELDRERFRAAFGFLPHAADPSLEAMFQAVIRATRTGATRLTAVHLVLRGPGVTERLRFLPPGYAEERDVDLAVIRGRRSADALWALTPKGDLLAVAAGETMVLTQKLPALPDGYAWASFDVADSPDGPRIAAAWEQTRFTTVGEAGLYSGPVRAP